MGSALGMPSSSLRSPFIGAFLLLSWLEVSVKAGTRDTVSLRFQVQEVVDLQLEEPRITFEVSKFDPKGKALIRRDSTYRILANSDSPRRLIASLSAPIPAGTFLELELWPPQTGIVSTGSKVLGVEPVELLSGMGKVNRSGVLLTYTFHADISANVGSVSPSITFSVVP